MKNKLAFLLFAIVTGLSPKGYSQVSDNSTLQRIDTAAIYRQAIQYAMYPEKSKIYDSLVAITRSNKNLVWRNIKNEDYILAVTWKQTIKWYEPYLDSMYYPTGNYEIWVTTAPELLNRMKADGAKDVDARLKQLLGLPPNSEYGYFVEFWVRPQDLFRPCPDNEITDTKCDLCFPPNADSAYIQWINQSRLDRYYQCNLYDQYPWTELGYTYDWNQNNQRHIGLSEFVIGKNKKVILNAIYSTKGYLNKIRYSPSEENAMYQDAIDDAMVPTPAKIRNNLVSTNSKSIPDTVIGGSRYVLTVSWKGYIKPFQDNIDKPFYSTDPQYDIWVSIAPELIERMKYENCDNLDGRLKQLLGLPPQSSYSYFVEFWVKPEDLYRPCPDRDVTDSACSLCFPSGTDTAYINWVNGNRISRYYPLSCKSDDKYPWTQLGYTYDWNYYNTSHEGLSEFVIRKNAKIKIRSIVKTYDYLKSGCKVNQLVK